MLSAGQPVSAQAMAAAAVVLPMPISPNTNTSNPRLISSSTTATPTSKERQACSRVIAGPWSMLRVPAAILRTTSLWCGGKVAATPMSTTVRRLWVWRANTLIAAPPCTKLATICAVTSDG